MSRSLNLDNPKGEWSVKTVRLWTFEEIKRRNREAGNFWFEEDTMKFFQSQLHGAPYTGPGGVTFVSSEQCGSDPRLFTVRTFDPKTGSVTTWGAFRGFTTEEDAHLAAQLVANGQEE